MVQEIQRDPVRRSTVHVDFRVVGDDDQALYRFRGATVENFVDFPRRCQRSLGVQPRRIDLQTNSRSRAPILEFYRDFMDHCDWARASGDGHYRVVPKTLKPHRAGDQPAVIASTPGHPDDVCAEIAALVRRLLGREADQRRPGVCDR